MAKQVLVVFNPAAKSQVDVNVKQWIGQIVEKLNEYDEYLVTFYPTTVQTEPKDLVELFKSPLDLVIAAGGDGTVRFVLAALAESRSEIPAAIFPLGTANVLARNLGIMLEKLLADPLVYAVEYILNGTPMRIDLGMMNGEYFAVGSGVGPLSDAISYPDRAEKTSLKLIAYVKALLGTIAIRPRVFKITIGDKSFTVQASGVFVCNVEDMAIGRDIDFGALTDGFLDLHIMNPKGFKDYVNLGFRYVGGNSKDHVADYALGVKEVVVEIVPRKGVRSAFQKAGLRVKTFLAGERPVGPGSGEELPCMIDGEVHSVTPLRVKVIPQAVNVLIPQ